MALSLPSPDIRGADGNLDAQRIQANFEALSRTVDRVPNVVTTLPSDPPIGTEVYYTPSTFTYTTEGDNSRNAWHLRYGPATVINPTTSRWAFVGGAPFYKANGGGTANCPNNIFAAGGAGLYQFPGNALQFTAPVTGLYDIEIGAGLQGINQLGQTIVYLWAMNAAFSSYCNAEQLSQPYNAFGAPYWTHERLWAKSRVIVTANTTLTLRVGVFTAGWNPTFSSGHLIVTPVVLG